MSALDDCSHRPGVPAASPGLGRDAAPVQLIGDAEVRPAAAAHALDEGEPELLVGVGDQLAVLPHEPVRRAAVGVASPARVLPVAFCRRPSRSRLTVRAGSSCRNAPRIWRMAVRIGSGALSVEELVARVMIKKRDLSDAVAILVAAGRTPEDAEAAAQAAFQTYSKLMATDMTASPSSGRPA